MAMRLKFGFDTCLMPPLPKNNRSTSNHIITEKGGIVMLHQAKLWGQIACAASWNRGMALALLAALSLAGLSSAEDPLGLAELARPRNEWRIARKRPPLVDKWSPKGENLLWAKPEYASRSTPIVMNGKLFVVLST